MIDHDFTQRECTLCFVWSRMRVIDESAKAVTVEVVAVVGGGGEIVVVVVAIK